MWPKDGRNGQNETSMANFAICVPDGKRKDGTYSVKIRLYHNRQRVWLRTSFYIDVKMVTKSGKIKDQAVIDSCENTIREWRKYVVELGVAADALTASELADYLRRKSKDAHGFRLDFIEHTRGLADRKVAKTGLNYINIANSLAEYVGGVSLDIVDVTAHFLRGYEEWLRDKGLAQGTINGYMSLVKSSHNQAKLDYNDEDRGVIRISQSPFAKYTMPKPSAPMPRAVDLATLQKIADLEDEKRLNSVRDLARDVFMLSFALGGINAVDLYVLPPTALKGDYIEYNRRKTKDKRADKALYRVHIHEAVKPLIERWRDPFGKRLFRFYLRRVETSFPIAISDGIGKVEAVIPYTRHYTFYSARHTYASLGYNAVGLDKYVIHELLNHTDGEMKITDRYIERDWQKLFDAHDKIIELVDWTKICKERG